MHPDGFDRMQCQLVLAFGESSLITETPVFNHLERSYPEACILLCSTDDNILSGNIVAVTAVEFDNTSILCAETSINEHTSNFEAGKYLMRQLQPKESITLYIVADGAGIDGHELVNGFNIARSNDKRNTNHITPFIKRMAGLNKSPGEGTVVAIAFRGDEQDLFQMEQYLRIAPTAIVKH